ncbi:MAG: DUF5330 domain-containing protein [Parvibaculum sp.]|nr:DUF5330 domain-containing protein [Parvibaculum sp.]|tara:strand:+ start:5816 stop:6217 length:402 start_codon:yes stop_codon:yes gene_type:complete
MSFILRAAFWLTVLAFLLPTAGQQATAQNNKSGGAMSASYTDEAPADDIGAGEMLSLAAQSAGDVLGFCDRNPQVCSRGSAVAGHIARQGSYYGAQAFLWVTEKARETQSAEPDALAAETMPRLPARKNYTGA